jgi:hypothetical protein
LDQGAVAGDIVYHKSAWHNQRVNRFPCEVAHRLGVEFYTIGSLHLATARGYDRAFVHCASALWTSKSCGNAESL